MQISVAHTIDQLRGQLNTVQREQLPFATSLAINATAKKAQAAMPLVFERLLDRPKPFTTKSGFFVQPGNKTTLRATVGIKDKQAEYLAPLLAGGNRQQKISEARFLGRFFAPGRAAPIDRYGNISKAVLLAILRAAQTRGEWRGRRIVVLPNATGRLPAGVYAAPKTSGKGPREMSLLLLFQNGSPGYKRRIRFGDEVAGVVRAEFLGEFVSAMNRALASAR